MDRFTAPLDLREVVTVKRKKFLWLVPYNGRVQTWITLAPFEFHFGDGEVVRVPAGFETDLASVPRPLWAILPPFGVHGQAAVTHDWLYNQRRVHGWIRSKCDHVFLLAMRCLGVSITVRRAMYRGVRIGGWVAWNKK